MIIDLVRVCGCVDRWIVCVLCESGGCLCCVGCWCGRVRFVILCCVG